MKAAALGSVVVFGLVSGCGGDDGGCPTDDCTLKGHTVVKWTFNASPERGFSMDSCSDLDVAKVNVEVVDATGGVQGIIEECGVAQATFSGLAPGDYTVYVTPLDAAGDPIVTQPASGTIAAGTLDAPTEKTINVPYESWPPGYEGTFLFRISWGGLSCDASTPVIKDQTIKLVVNGVPVTLTTDDGQMTNGTDRKPCKKLTDEFPQSVLKVPFGPATFLVQGFDDTGTMTFGSSFDTFVGAGISNPTLTFDVPLM